MNRLPERKRVMIIRLLTEGMGMRATARAVDCAKSTVEKFLDDFGPICEDLHELLFRNLKIPLVQIDELWAFVEKKDKNCNAEEKACEGIGSVWTWTAMCPTTKVIVAWVTGSRTVDNAVELMSILNRRLQGKTTIISDGYAPYINAVEEIFGKDVAFARVVKQYDGRNRYVGAERVVVQGRVKKSKISTSITERMNFTIRMRNRRFTRRTNAHSKKIERHRHSLAILMAVYHFCTIHETLRVSPAMSAGVTDHLWSVEELLRLME